MESNYLEVINRKLQTISLRSLFLLRQRLRMVLWGCFFSHVHRCQNVVAFSLASKSLEEFDYVFV